MSHRFILRHLVPTVFGLAALLVAPLSAQDFSASTIVAPGAQLEKISGEFSFTEGPAADAKGNIFFTDQPNDRIMVWTVDGKMETFMKPAGRSNGLCFDGEGKLIACADEKNEMWSIDVQGVYRVAKGSDKLVRVIGDLQQPNGIIGSPDGKLLYVTDIKGKKTYRYDIAADGSLSGKKLHCDMGSDGMTLDDQGNLYLTNKGVTVFDPSGKQIQHIEVPEGWTANICFGGADKKLLFITASKGVYGLKMKVGGVGSQ